MNADLTWLKDAENWGEWIRFDEMTGERESVWMMKSGSGSAVRFYAIGKGQVGKQHTAIYQATCWAYGTGYLPAEAYEDDRSMFQALACRAEIKAGGMAPGANGAAA